MIEDVTMFTVQEAAALLHMSKSRVRQLVREGRLKGHIHMGRRWTKRIMILESDLKQFIHTFYLESYWPGNKRPEYMPDHRGRNKQKKIEEGNDGKE